MGNVVEKIDEGAESLGRNIEEGAKSLGRTIEKGATKAVGDFLEDPLDVPMRIVYEVGPKTMSYEETRKRQKELMNKVGSYAMKGIEFAGEAAGDRAAWVCEAVGGEHKGCDKARELGRLPVQVLGAAIQSGIALAAGEDVSQVIAPGFDLLEVATIAVFKDTPLEAVLDYLGGDTSAILGYVPPDIKLQAQFVPQPCQNSANAVCLRLESAKDRGSCVDPFSSQLKPCDQVQPFYWLQTGELALEPEGRRCISYDAFGVWDAIPCEDAPRWNWHTNGTLHNEDRSDACLASPFMLVQNCPRAKRTYHPLAVREDRLHVPSKVDEAIEAGELRTERRTEELVILRREPLGNTEEGWMLIGGLAALLLVFSTM